MKNYKKKVIRLYDLCKNFIDAVETCGNECAWTDRKLEAILDCVEELKEEYYEDLEVLL